MMAGVFKLLKHSINSSADNSKKYTNFFVDTHERDVITDCINKKQTAVIIYRL